MSFYVKISLAVAALVLVALGAIFLFSSSDEKAIEKLLEQGLKAAEEGNEEGVIALIAVDYGSGPEDRERIIRRIRQAVAQRVSPAKLKGAAIQVSGDEADADAQVVVGALQYRQEFGLRLKLRRGNGMWKVTKAEETKY